MKRLTVNKKTDEMTMTELAHNCCYVKNREAMYRDYDKDLSARDFIRKIMVQHGFWEDHEKSVLADTQLFKDDVFDDTMIDLLQLGEGDQEGLIALFYRNLWAMAELRDTLKGYENTGLYPEQIMYIKAMHLDGMRNRERMEKYFTTHRQQCGEWKHGEPQRYWIDENDNFCIKYMDGSWWHYKENDTVLGWW